MRVLTVAFVCLLALAGAAEDQTLDLAIDGVTWAKTVITPYDKSSKESRDATYKVYTHVMDFAGKEPITKGAGGKYPHHRGLFIGWRETTVGDKKYDTWHMTDCYQQYVETVKDPNRVDSPMNAAQLLAIEWRDSETDKPFIRETRLIEVSKGPEGKHIVDMVSVLTAVDKDVTLRGDSHHAGMQIRLADEVSDKEKETEYLLPEGAKRIENDEVSGAAWAVCHVTIGGKPYWVMHMTPPPSEEGDSRFSSKEVKLYSIRPYARFGAFFEPDIRGGHTQSFMTRVVVSEKPIDLEEANLLYKDYGRRFSRATGY